MIDEILLLCLGLMIAFNFGHFMTLRRCEGALLSLSMEAKTLSEYDPSPMIEDLMGEVTDILTQALSAMRTPSIADHLGGVISQFAQMKMVRMMKNEGMLEAPEIEQDLD